MRRMLFHSGTTRHLQRFAFGLEQFSGHIRPESLPHAKYLVCSFPSLDLYHFELPFALTRNEASNPLPMMNANTSKVRIKLPNFIRFIAAMGPRVAPINNMKVYRVTPITLASPAMLPINVIRVGTEIAIPVTKTMLIPIRIGRLELIPMMTRPAVAKSSPPCKTCLAPNLPANRPANSPERSPKAKRITRC